MRDELDDDLGVGGGLEEGALALEARAQIAEVHQIAVVRNGDEALGGFDANGLRVEQRGVAGGRVARVADGDIAGELRSTSSVKMSATRPMPLMFERCCAVGGGDAGGLLSAMLQSVEHEVDLARGIGMAVNGGYSALFVKRVVASGMCSVARWSRLRLDRDGFRSKRRGAKWRDLQFHATV